MPKPLKKESKSHYISRCVTQVMKEGKKQDAALGQCYGMWEEYKKKHSKASITIFKGDEIIFVDDDE